MHLITTVYAGQYAQKIHCLTLELKSVTTAELSAPFVQVKLRTAQFANLGTI